MKRLCCLVFVCVLMLSLSARVTPCGAADSDAEKISESINQFKEKYPHGSVYVDDPALTGGYECFGFANELALAVFGCYPTASVSAENINFGWERTYGSSAVEKLCVGDIVRYHSHSIFITGISGDTVYYAQANVPVGTNKVSYDNKTTKAELKSKVSEPLTSGGTTKPGWVAHFRGFAPIVTSISVSNDYGAVQAEYTISFPATYAQSYELTVTNTSANEVALHTTVSKNSYKYRFPSVGLYLIRVTAHGQGSTSFEPMYFEVHSQKEQEAFINGQKGPLALTAQRLTFSFNADLPERIQSANIRVIQKTDYGLGLYYEKKWSGSNEHGFYCEKGEFYAYAELTYESGYRVYTEIVEWSVDSGAAKGDVNNDGNVDNLDAAWMLKYDAGIIIVLLN